mgnify:CR=1 FL=1
MNKLYTILFACCLGTFTLNAATLSLDPAVNTVAYGDAVAISVKVEGFTNVGGMQFSINWDPTALQFTGIGNYNLSGLLASNFGTHMTANGKLSMGWFSTSLAGITVPDGTAIVTLYFNTLGLPGSSTQVVFSNTPTPKLLFEPSLNEISTTYEDAVVNIVSSSLSIYGNIHRENGANIPNVQVDLSGTTSGSQITSNHGNYLFSNLTSGGNYTITPYRNDNHAECLTIADLLKISRHILGEEPLTSPYAIIRADVNKSRSITSFDIALLRKVILGIDPQFSSNTSWRFVPADYVFPQPANPFFEVFPETGEALNLSADQQIDFIGLKTGDVMECGGVQGAPFVTLSTPHLTANNGDLITVDVAVDGFTDVAGMQFSMGWDPTILQFNGVQNYNLPIDASSFNTNNASSGQLSFAWVQSAGITLAGGTAIFQLTFSVIGSQGEVSPLSFVETPTIFEVLDGSYNTFGLAHNNGSVTVTGGGGGTNEVSFAASNASATQGQSACINVSVEDFVDIAGAQFSMQFDPAFLSFSSIQNYNLPGLSASNFATFQASSGILAFSWLDPSFSGVTVPDGTVIFSVCFTTLQCGSTNFNFSGTPTTIEVADINGNILTTRITGGGANIGCSTFSCIDQLNVSVNNNCTATLTLDALLVGGPFNPADFTIDIYQGPGQTNLVVSGTGTVTIPSGYAGQTLLFVVTQISTNTSCWGMVTVEDKIKPNPICFNGLSLTLISGLGTLYPADINAGSYDNCGSFTLSISDDGINYGSSLSVDCNDIGNLTVYLKATDAAGNSDYCITTVQIFGNNTWYLDADGDSFGNPAVSLTTCTPPPGFVSNNSDCNDSDASINPYTVWFRDIDNDGYSDGVWLQQCNQPSGYKRDISLTATSGDCNDNDNTVYPGAPELCDGKDNDCDTLVDEAGPVPAPWVNVNVGAANGTSTFIPCGPFYGLTAMGNSVPNADKIRFTHRTLCGNGTITVRVENLIGGGWAGIAMRENNTPGSRMVALKTRLSTISNREFRVATNGNRLSSNISTTPAHRWLRITRSGNNFYYYISTTGFTFQYVGAVSVAMPSCVLIGMYVESINAGTTTSAVFSNVSFSGAVTLPAPSDPGDIDIDQIAASAIDFQIFPNPSSGEVNLAIEGQLGQEADIRLFDALGKNLLSKKLEVGDAPVHQLDLSGFVSGVYFIQMHIPGELPVTKRIVLER